MAVHNAEIAGLFNRYADLLEIRDANSSQIRLTVAVAFVRKAIVQTTER